MSVLENCEPKKLFEYFEWLSGVPHGSGNTKAISDRCVQFAKEHHLAYVQDELNNVIIYKDATPGYEQADAVILQGHLDMVCAKEPDDPMDMAKEPVRLKTDGEWVFTENTSLGGDNLVAVACTLAILDDDTLCHPRLEALFTVDEETGMEGANGLDPSLLTGTRMMNMDSEDDGFTVSCAGGIRMNGMLPVKRESAGESVFYEITVAGLLGGHSGCDIDKERASAHQLMGRVLHTVQETVPLRLLSCEGGKFDNVIPLKNTTVAAIRPQDAHAFEALIERLAAELKEEWTSEPGLIVEARPVKAIGEPVTAKDTERILNLLMLLPQGVQHMSVDLPGLVQTSLNTGIVNLNENKLAFTVFVRSCVASQKQAVAENVRQLVALLGGKTEIAGSYPGWAYRKDSPLRDIGAAVYRDLFGKDPDILATHGGLECGILLNKMPNVDCISFGPILKDVHSVREKLNIASTGHMYRMVREILARCR